MSPKATRISALDQAVLVEVLHDGNAPEDGSHDEREHVHAARVGFQHGLPVPRRDATG